MLAKLQNLSHHKFPLLLGKHRMTQSKKQKMADAKAGKDKQKMIILLATAALVFFGMIYLAD